MRSFSLISSMKPYTLFLYICNKLTRNKIPNSHIHSPESILHGPSQTASPRASTTKRPHRAAVCIFRTFYISSPHTVDASCRYTLRGAHRGCDVLWLYGVARVKRGNHKTYSLILSHLPANSVQVVRVVLSPVPLNVLLDVTFLRVTDPVLQFHKSDETIRVAVYLAHYDSGNTNILLTRVFLTHCV